MIHQHHANAKGSGTECGPFRAIEESTLAHLIKEEDRGDIYAWYSLLGGIGSACGLGICGLILHYLENLGWSTLKAYHTIFWGYSALGVAMLIIVLFLSKACELKNKPPLPASSSSSIIGSEDENKTPVTLKLPKFSQKSRVIVVKLCILFALDSFAVSLAPTYVICICILYFRLMCYRSWITFFFHDKFALAENKLGTIFFATSFIAALSMLPASSLAKRFGNINVRFAFFYTDMSIQILFANMDQTMVLAHLPGAIFLTLVPIPSSLSISTTFLIMRSITQSMDTAPRSAFMAGVVESHERTPMMSCVLVAKSSASSISPLIIGVLAGRGYLWVAFVAAGCLMCVYDCAFWVLFGRQIVNNKDSDVEKNASSGELGARGGFWSSAETLTNAGNKKKEASGAEERDASGDEKTEMSVGVTDVVADGSSVSSQIPVAHSEQKQ